MSARLYDALVNLAAHPFGWPAAQLLRAAGPLVRVPGLGVVVNDLELAHEILGRDAAFTKNGEGSIAAVFTQAMGPFALANMDGDAHRQLRSRLGDLLTPARCQSLLDACRAPLDVACQRLEQGGRVDLVTVTRTLSGRLTMEMMGITPSTGDKTQQRIFMIMPFFFLFICYNFASALALYWTTQNIFGIVQTWITKRMPEPALERRAASAKKRPPGWPGSPFGAPAKKPKPPAPRTGGAAKSARKKSTGAG